MALTDNLISYWKLDEASGNALDAHGSNDLTDNNTVGSAVGKVGNARDFDSASSEWFSSSDNAALSTGDIDFTIAAWVKMDTVSGVRRVVGKGGSNDLEYELDYDSGGARFRFRVTSAAGFANDTSVSASSPQPAVAGTWYHLVAWHDSVNNQLGITVNAGTPDTVSYSAGTYDSGGQFGIGKSPFYGGFFDGLIDEVGFWKRVLTSDERTQLYNSGNGLSYDDFGGGGGGTFQPAWARRSNILIQPGFAA